MAQHELGAIGIKRSDGKEKKKPAFLQSLSNLNAQPVRGSQELDVDIELHAVQQKRDSLLDPHCFHRREYG